MTKEKIYLFDTTLRDGAQTQGVDFSIDDKAKITKALSTLGVDYIEAGWQEPILWTLVFSIHSQTAKIQS